MTILAALILSGTAVAATDKQPPRHELVADLRHARTVVGFFEQHSWLRAPRHRKCAGVPWRRDCRIARRVYGRAKHNTVRLEQALRRYLPDVNDWATAVAIVQRPFPGTAGWLLSCSGAEGSHGSFVVYGGGDYYPGAEYAKTFHGWMVGGWMQYMWPTFRGHYRHALESIRSRDYKVDLPPPADVRAWRDPLAQALAAGWARWSGNDAGHWRASWGNGC